MSMPDPEEAHVLYRFRPNVYDKLKKEANRRGLSVQGLIEHIVSGLSPEGVPFDGGPNLKRYFLLTNDHSIPQQATSAEEAAKRILTARPPNTTIRLVAETDLITFRSDLVVERVMKGATT